MDETRILHTRLSSELLDNTDSVNPSTPSTASANISTVVFNIPPKLKPNNNSSSFVPIAIEVPLSTVGTGLVDESSSEIGSSSIRRASRFNGTSISPFVEPVSASAVTSIKFELGPKTVNYETVKSSETECSSETDASISQTREDANISRLGEDTKFLPPGEDANISQPSFFDEHNKTLTNRQCSEIKLRIGLNSDAKSVNGSASDDRRPSSESLGSKVVEGVCCVPVFDKKLKSSAVSEGESARFSCCVKGQSAVEVHWEKDGKPISNGENFKISCVDGEHTLEVKCTSMSDAGRYVCIVSNSAGEARNMSSLMVQQNNNFKHSPLLQHRLLLDKTRGSKEPVTSSSTILVSATRAQLPVHHLTDDPTKQKPVAEFIAAEYQAVEGQSVSLCCAVSGSPTPKVVWFHEKDLVKESVTCRISRSHSICTLDIDNVSTNQSGRYVCKAENEFGLVRPSCTLTVNKESKESNRNIRPASLTDIDIKAPFSSIPGDIITNQSFGAVLNITSAGSDHVHSTNAVTKVTDTNVSQTMTTPTVSADVTLNDCNAVVSSSSSRADSTTEHSSNEKRPSLTKLNINLSNSGGIVSSRNNNIVSPANDKYVEQDLLPMHERSLSPSRQTSDSHCSASLVDSGIDNDGTNKTPATMSLHDMSRLSGETCISSEDQPLASDCVGSPVTKFLQNPNPEDSGTSRGSGSIDEPPLIEDIQPENASVRRGSTVELTAKFVGHPPLEAVWMRGNQRLFEGDRIVISSEPGIARLTLKNTEPCDTGCYQLVLSNEFGCDKLHSSVTVEDRPDPPVSQPAVTSITDKSIVLSWTGSSYDGGSPVLRYQVEMKAEDEESESAWIVVVDDCEHTTYKVTNLKPNTAYRFRIRTGNKHGLSDPGEESDLIITTRKVTSRSVEGSLDNLADIDSRSLPDDICSPVMLEGRLSPVSLLAARGNELPFEPHPVTIDASRKFADFYVRGEEIGKGKFGSVCLCTERSSGLQFAAKFIRVKASQKEEFHKEIEVMNELRHPKILLLWDAFETARELILVMEHVGGRELLERIINDDYILTERECVHFMRQICEGVRYMHSRNILHLDLKPENILCVTMNGNEIKIIDFGLARKFDPTKSFKVMFGTPEFVAPEVVNYDEINCATDMWSIGVIAYVLLSGISPFLGDTEGETLSNVTAGQYDFDDEGFTDISNDAKDFISALLLARPKDRMSADQSLEHIWLSQDVTYMRAKKLSIARHKRFMARRNWQKTKNAFIALGRMAVSHRRSPFGGKDLNDSDSSSPPPSSIGDKPESVVSDDLGKSAPSNTKRHVRTRSLDLKSAMAGGLSINVNPTHPAGEVANKTLEGSMKVRVSSPMVVMTDSAPSGRLKRSEDLTNLSEANDALKVHMDSEDVNQQDVFSVEPVRSKGDGVLNADKLLSIGRVHCIVDKDLSVLKDDRQKNTLEQKNNTGGKQNATVHQKASLDNNDNNRARGVQEEILPSSSSVKIGQSCDSEAASEKAASKPVSNYRASVTSENTSTVGTPLRLMRTRVVSLNSNFDMPITTKTSPDVRSPASRKSIDLTTKPFIQTRTSVGNKSPGISQPQTSLHVNNTSNKSPGISQPQTPLSGNNSSNKLLSTRGRGFSSSTGSNQTTNSSAHKVESKTSTVTNPYPQSKFTGTSSTVKGTGVGRRFEAEYLSAVNKELRPKIKAPVFVRKMKNAEVLEKSSAKFEVRIDGYPEPSIIWLKDGVQIIPSSDSSSSAKYSAETTADGRSCLVIENCGEDDDAEYTCCASNALGSVTTKANLYVEPYDERLPPTNAN